MYCTAVGPMGGWVGGGFPVTCTPVDRPSLPPSSPVGLYTEGINRLLDLLATSGCRCHDARACSSKKKMLRNITDCCF